MDIKRLMVPLIGAALVGGAVAGVGLTAFAASGTPGSTSSPQATTAGAHGPGGPGAFGGGVSGTVTAVNGSSITVSGADGATYTVNDSSASVEKYANGASAPGTASSIAVGDTVMIDGTITTASLSAKSIRDNFPKPVAPAAMGKVTAVNGSTITISGMARPTTMGQKPTATTYTVDASNATVTKVSTPATKGAKPTETTIAASAIAVGDMITVEGTANGTSVTATSITDGTGFGLMMGGPGKR